MLRSAMPCVSHVAPSVCELTFEMRQAGWELITGEIHQGREVRHAASASEMWEEGLTVGHGLETFLATHLPAWHFIQIVKESNDRTLN
jgi:hypothetical protein